MLGCGGEEGWRCHKDCPNPEGEERIPGDCPLGREESRSPHSQPEWDDLPSGAGGTWAGGTSHRDKPRDFHGQTFLALRSQPPREDVSAGSSELENLLGQWGSSQLADKSPQWEQPVLFPTLLVIPRARKYPQIPLASPFLSHESPFPPLESTPQNALLGFSSWMEQCFLLMKVRPKEGICWVPRGLTRRPLLALITSGLINAPLLLIFFPMFELNPVLTPTWLGWDPDLGHSQVNQHLVLRINMLHLLFWHI